ncbi:helix-turn-helix domain-containing protein [Salidesulfovibrio brasiliensis]
MGRGTIQYIRPQGLDGIEIQAVIDSGHSFPNHTHPVHSVGIMDAGGCYCRQPGMGSSFVRAGEVALFNPGLVHSGVITSPGTRISYWVVSFGDQMLERAARELAEKDGLPEFRSVVVQDRLIHRVLRELGVTVAGRAERLALDTAVSRASAALLSRHCEIRPRVPGSPEPRAVKRAREYLHENLSGEVTLEQLAGVAGLSRYHLLRVFRDVLGLPPHGYHMQLRIEHAKRLLREGCRFSEVALESGFSDQSHFSNTFRRYTGATPSQYISG